MSSLSSTSITSALEWFEADAVRLTQRFHSNFDRKLIGGNALRWILSNGSNIIAAPAGRQSPNGLAERTWHTIIQIARAFVTDKQVGRELWYFEVIHAAMIINQVTGRLGLKLTTPFELVHNSKPNSKTWFELFFIGYFNHDIDNAEIRSKLQAHTLDGIAVGRYYWSNSIIFYSPITSSYYRPPDFRLDESRLPITNFPNYFRFMVASPAVY